MKSKNPNQQNLFHRWILSLSFLGLALSAQATPHPCNGAPVKLTGPFYLAVSGVGLASSQLQANEIAEKNAAERTLENFKQTYFKNHSCFDENFHCNTSFRVIQKSQNSVTSGVATLGNYYSVVNVTTDLYITCTKSNYSKSVYTEGEHITARRTEGSTPYTTF